MLQYVLNVVTDVAEFDKGGADSRGEDTHQYEQI